MRRATVTAAALVLTLGLAACDDSDEQESSVQPAEQQASVPDSDVDRAVDDVKAAADAAAERTGEAVDQASKEMDDAVSKASDAIGQALGEASQSAKGAGERMVQELNVIADELEKVTDEASAKAAAEVIDKAQKGLEEVGAQFEAMTNIERAQVITAVSQELQKVQSRIAQAMTAIAQKSPQLMQELGNAMSDLPQVDQPASSN